MPQRLDRVEPARPSGGPGGFFPPLVIGVIHQSPGSFTQGFVLLAASALVCLAVPRATNPRRPAAALQPR